jgi:O-antigen/teichoic acid export membrane protein
VSGPPPDPAGRAAGPVQSEAAARTTGASVLRGGGWNAASLVIPQLYLFATSIIAARFLGPVDMGRQSFIAFAGLSMVFAVTGGFPYALMRFISESLGRGQPEKVRGLLDWAWRIEIVAALIGAGVIAGAGVLGATPAAAWILAGLACGLAVLQTVPAAVLGGLQLWRGVSITGLVTGGLATGGIALVLALGGGITGMFAVEVMVTVVTLAVSGVLARRALAEHAPRAQDDPELRRRVVRYAMVGSLNALLAFIVFRRSEFLFLKAFSTDVQIALYSIAFAAVAGLNQLFEAAANVISPAFATLHGAERRDRIRSGYSRTVRLVLLLSLPMSAAAVALGPGALSLVYGNEYSDAGTLLVMMASTLPIISLIGVSRALMGGLGREKAQLAIGVVAAVVNIVLDLVLIPAHGAIGAAIANAAAQVSAAVPYLVYCSRALNGVDWQAGALARAALASLVMGAAALGVHAALGGFAGVLAGGIAATVVFALAAWALRIVPEGDAEWIDSSFGARLGGAVGRMARAMARRPVGSRD